MIRVVAVYFVMAFSLWMLFGKIGRWSKKLALIPVLNQYLVFRAAGVEKEYFWYLISNFISWLLVRHYSPVTFMFAAGAAIFALILRGHMAYHMARCFGAGKILAAGILFFPGLIYLDLTIGMHSKLEYRKG